MIKKTTVKFLFPVFALLLLQSNIHAQSTSESKDPIAYLEKADSLYIKKNYEPSTALINHALVLYKAKDDINGMVTCHNKMALNQIARQEYGIAKLHLDSVSTLFKSYEKADSLSLGEYHYLFGQIDHMETNFENSSQHMTMALEYYESAIEVDEFDLALVHQYQGANYYHLWNHPKAEKHLMKALQIYLKNEPKTEDRISRCYSYLARIYTRSEQHSKALTYNKKTLALNRKIYGETHSQVGLAHAIMAITYGRMDNFEKSLMYFEKANRNFIANFGEEHRWVVTTYENIGRAYNRLGDNDKSLENYKKAIALGIKHLGADNLTVAHVFLNAADTYASIGDNSMALELYGKALAVQIKAYGERHREVAQNYIAQGNFYNHILDYDAAIEMFDRVLNTYKSEISRVYTSDLILEDIYVFYKIVEAIEGKALSYKLRYQNDRNLENLNLSKELYGQAEAIIEKMRLATTTIEDKIYLTSSNQISLRGIIETSFQLSEAQEDQSLLQEAFYQSERNRARILRQVSQQSAMNSSDNELIKLLENEKKIKEDKSLYLSKIEQEKLVQPNYDSLKLAEYENELFRINLKYDTLLIEMRNKYPNYFKLEFGSNHNDLDEIQASLNTNTTLLEYFVADSSTTYAFLISKKTFSGLRLSTPGLLKNVALLKKAILDKNTADFKESSFKLYQDLLAPITDKLVGEALIIIPDGPLWHVNFELLLTSKSISNNPKHLDYLLRKYVISYANSAGMPLSSKPGETALENDVLAFSFSENNANTTVSNMSLAALRNRDDDLPGTRKEIKEIAKFIDGDYFFGNQAQEVNFKTNATKYRILHLALHGEVDNENPQHSRLYFTKGKDSLEDNVLYSHELSNLALASDLVVLSACNTGTGKVAAGEGMMSLGNAFQYAGAKSLLISGWEVSDETTPELMKLFYGNIKQGMSKPKALQQAKLAYLETAEAFRSAPFYWGSFCLVGDTAPIALGVSNLWVYMGLGLLFSTAGIFVFRRRFRSRT